MDFNLSGTDAVLSYAFYECHYIMRDDEVKDAIKRGDYQIASVDERTRRNLGYGAREYSFNDAECSAFSAFYHLAVPFWGCNFESYNELIHDHGGEFISQILDFIEYHLTRADVSDWLS
jgi:hypothetical protein